MKDEQYFDDKLFVYTNKELKEKIMKHIKNNNLNREIQVPLYMIVDEALRKYLTEQNIDFDKEPRRTQLM